MNIDRFVLAFAGFVVLVSLALGIWVSQWWFVLNAFVGVNLFQAAFSGFCPLAMILKRVGFKTGQAFA